MTLRKILSVASLTIISCLILFFCIYKFYNRPFTHFTDRYSEASFLGVPLGATRNEVIQTLGYPLLEKKHQQSEFWYYNKETHSEKSTSGIVSQYTFNIFDTSMCIEFDSGGIVKDIRGTLWPDSHNFINATKQVILDKKGSPSSVIITANETNMYFSRPADNKHETYKVRGFTLNAENEVVRRIKHTYWD